MAFSLVNHPFLDTPMTMETPKYWGMWDDRVDKWWLMISSDFFRNPYNYIGDDHQYGFFEQCQAVRDDIVFWTMLSWDCRIVLNYLSFVGLSVSSGFNGAMQIVMGSEPPDRWDLQQEDIFFGPFNHFKVSHRQKNVNGIVLTSGLNH